MHGYEVAKTLRREVVWNQVKLISTTACGYNLRRGKSKAAGLIFPLPSLRASRNGLKYAQ
jgi:hypothetical protein